MRKLKVLVVPSDRTGVGFYRSTNPHLALENNYPNVAQSKSAKWCALVCVDEILNSNKVSIPSFDARVEGSVEKFQKDNPKFKISWDGFKIGEIGCFISHYIAWNYLLNSELDELLIFEDDVFIDETFVKKYQLAINNVPEDYDVLSIFVDSNQHDRFKESDKINYYISKGYQDWSTLCYIISKQGAEKLCKYVEEIGMDHPADWFIFRKGHAGIFNVYTLPPYIKNPVNIDKRYDSQVQ